MKNTKQRETIYKALEETDQALSPEQLLELCQESVSNIGIATIHRELKRLRDEDKLEEVRVHGDVLRFCLKDKHHHHHFKCNSCNNVYDIPCGSIEVKLPKGFKKAEHEVNVFGVCGNCS